MQSDDVLRVLADDLENELGFTVERGKNKLGQAAATECSSVTRAATRQRTRLMAFQAQEGIALEVEAGRATMGNAIYRDLIEGSLMVDARYLVLAVPQEYRYGKASTKEPSFAKTYSVVEAIYGSERLSLPFDGDAACFGDQPPKAPEFPRVSGGLFSQGIASTCSGVRLIVLASSCRTVPSTPKNAVNPYSNAS